MGLFISKESDDDCMETIIGEIAQAQMLAASGVWVGLLLRLGIPKSKDRLPVIICRFASNVLLPDDENGRGEEVRLLTLDAFENMRSKILQYPRDEIGYQWRRAMLEITPPNTFVLSEYSEINVATAAQNNNRLLRKKLKQEATQRRRFFSSFSDYFDTRINNDPQTSGYLLMRSDSLSSSSSL